jgi:Asp-tRNA(Asn)/Glu-tRNA(Gln) amidotransferase A subunit family amidase
MKRSMLSLPKLLVRPGASGLQRSFLKPKLPDTCTQECTHHSQTTSMQSLRASSTIARDSKASNAWVTRLELRGSPSGPLENVKFAVKDLFSIAGHTNGCGNPTWLETHSAAVSHAPCVQRLLESGAVLAGVTQMDELAYSLNGENVHYGTPANAAAADRVPGGSSSGSAVC